MPTLDDLKRQHPEWCFRCGMRRPNCSDPCGRPQPVVITALIAAKLEDEATIRELISPCHCTDYTVCDKCQLARRKVPILESQLTAEQQAHAETRRQLEEADKKVIRFWRALTSSHDFFSDPSDMIAYHRALARQASTNRPTDNSPTDDRGEGEK